MMPDQKIIGIVQCRNEWGLIAVAVSYALLNHVDEVYVLDDASSDQTASGMRQLQSLWGSRLHVLRTEDIGFRQEAMINTIINLAGRSRPDWVYVFDADEFLLAKHGDTLRTIVSGLNENVIALNYPLENFISTRNFNPNYLDDYRKLRYRSTPTMSYQPEMIYNQIYNGKATFFDVPFPPKVIFRYSELTRLKEGAHSIEYFGDSAKGRFEDRIAAAHVTLSARSRLQTKARQGEFFVKQGLPKEHGWQCQLIYQLESESRLDWFWNRHSIEQNGQDANGAPAHAIDERFVKALEPTLRFLAEAFGSADIGCLSGTPMEASRGEETMVSLHEVMLLTGVLQRKTDRLKAAMAKMKQAKS
jgi:hypothetical protein